MIEDPTKIEINLFDALKQISDSFNDDATSLPMGIQVLLRGHKVGSYVPKIAKVLKSRNLIKYNPEGTHKNPLIYWNGERPNLELCRSIMDEVREGNRIQWAKDHPRTEAEEKQIQKLMEHPILEENCFSKGESLMIAEKIRNAKSKAKEQLIFKLKEDAVEKLYQAEIAIIEAKAVLKYLTNKIELLNDGII